MEIIVNRDTDEEIAYFEDRDGDRVQIVATKERTLSTSAGMILNRHLAAELWPFIMRFAETGKLSEGMTEQIGNAFTRTPRGMTRPGDPVDCKPGMEPPPTRTCAYEAQVHRDRTGQEPEPPATLRTDALNWLRLVLQAEAMEEALRELHHEVGIASANLIDWSRDAGSTPFLVEWCNQRYTVEFYGSGSIMYKRVVSPEEIEKEAAKK